MNSEKVPQPPAQFGTRHIQALLMSTSLIFAYAMRSSLYVAIVAMTNAKSTNANFKQYEWSSNEKSLILTSFMWGYVVLQIPGGYLVSMWSPQKLLSIGFLCSGVINVLTPILADQGGWMAVCMSRVAMGAFQACFLPAMHALVSKWAPPNERSRISTFISNGSTLGNVVAMALSGIIAASNLGWSGIFYVFGIANIVMSIAFYFNVTDSPAVHPTISEEEKTYIMESLWQMEHQSQKKPHPPWMQILTSLPVWAIIIVHFGVNWGSWTLLTEIPTYMKNVLQYEIAQNGLISSLPYVASWLLGFPFSWLADYALRKDVSVSVVRRVCNTLGTWLPALALIGLCFVDRLGSGWPVTMLVLAVGIMSANTCGFNVNHIDLSPNFAGAMYSISNCMGTVAGILAPMVCGLIVQDSVDPNKWHVVFYITAFIFFATNLVFIIFARGKTQSWNNPNRKVSIVSMYDPKIITTES